MADAIAAARVQAPYSRPGWMAWLTSHKEFLVLSVPLVLALVVFFILPLLNVFLLSVTEPSTGLGNYALLVSSEGIRHILWRTVRLCAVTTVFSVAAAYLVAYVLAASTPRQRSLMMFFILVPFWVSALVRAFAWLLLLGQDGPVNQALVGLGVMARPFQFLFNEVGVTLGMVHYMLPYAVLPLYALMKDIDPQLIRASRGLGATAFGAFIHTYLPLTVPAIVASSSLVLVYSLGFYIIPAILGGGRVLMIAQYISINVLETVRWGLASMLSVTLLVSVLLLSLATGRLGRRATQGGNA
ncbi:MAG TPA: ABC transporter permease [Bordetella sp.]